MSLLKESNEEADQKEYQKRTVARASKGDPFNPIAFGIPLLVIGVRAVRDGYPDWARARRHRDRRYDGSLRSGGLDVQPPREERIRSHNHAAISGEFYCAPMPQLDTLMSVCSEVRSLGRAGR